MGSEKLLNFENTLTLVIDRIGWGFYQFKVVAIIGIGSLSLGANFSIMTFLPFVLKSTWALSDLEISYLGTVSLMGGMFSYLFVMFYGEKIGRLNLLYISYLLVLIAGVSGAIMPEVYSEGLTRSLSNFARIGAMTSSTPYIIEVVPTNIRGACSVLFWIFFGVGEVLIILLAIWIMPEFDTSAWRILSIIASLPAILVLIGAYLYLKPSPLLLSKRNQHDKAIEILNYIAHQNSQPECTLLEIEQIRAIPQKVEDTIMRRIHTLFHRSLIKQHMVAICIWTLVLNNFYGLYFVFPYLVNVDYDRNIVGWVMFLCAAIQLPIAIGLMFTVENKHIGRMFSIIGSIVFVIVFSGIAIIKPFDWSFYLAIGLVYGFLDGITYVLYPYTCELYKTEIRTAALSFVNVIARLLCLGSPSFFLFLLESMPDLVFFMLIVSNGILVALILALKTETNNKVLDSY